MRLHSPQSIVKPAIWPGVFLPLPSLAVTKLAFTVIPTAFDGAVAQQDQTVPRTGRDGRDAGKKTAPVDHLNLRIMVGIGAIPQLPLGIKAVLG